MTMKKEKKAFSENEKQLLNWMALYYAEEPNIKGKIEKDSESLQTEIRGNIQPERQEELKELAKLEAQQYIFAVVYQSKIFLLLDKYKKTDKNGMEVQFTMSIETAKKLVARWNIEQPKTLSEQMFFSTKKWQYIVKGLTYEHENIIKSIIKTSESKAVKKMIENSLCDWGKIIENMGEKTKKFTGRKPLPKRFQVAELIYNAVMDGLRPPVPFEAARDTFMKYHCREGTTFAKQIMDILYEKMKPKEREKKELPKLPTLKKWLKEYMDTMTATTEEKQQ